MFGKSFGELRSVTMISDFEWSMYHSSDYYCGVIHFAMSLASPDPHIRPLAAGGETDDLVGEAFVAHVHTSGLLCPHTSCI